MRLGIVGVLAFGCGSGTVAKAVRDDVPKAERAVAAEPCLVGQEAQPWTFDMDNTTRGTLFNAMRDGLVLVSFDCKQLKVLTRCDVRGDYKYGGYPVAFDVLDFKDSDELKASISGGALIAAKFEADMKRGAKLFIAHGEVGMSTTTVPDVTRDQVKGPKACESATHYVTEVHFGAYQMKASSDADVKAAGDIFGRGASGASASSADSRHRSGDPKACERSSDRDGAAPEGCNHVVRVTLAPISPAGEKPAAEATPARAELPRPPPACPPGMERVGMVCRHAAPTSAPRPRSCKPGDAEDCAKQCEAGDARSCALAGSIYEHGTGVKPDPRAAFKYYEQACNAKWIDGCTGQAMLYSKGLGVPADGKRAQTMFTDACVKGNGRACSGLGQRLRLDGDVKAALPLFNRGCTLGYARACFYYASFGAKELPPGAALRSYERACMGRDLRGCLGASVAAKSGDATAQGMAAVYLDMGLKGLERACTANDGEACSALGDYYAGKYDPALKDPEKAKSYTEAACQAGQSDACKGSASKPPRRPPPLPPPPRSGPPKAPPKGPPPPPPGKP